MLKIRDDTNMSANSLNDRIISLRAEVAYHEKRCRDIEASLKCDGEKRLRVEDPRSYVVHCHLAIIYKRQINELLKQIKSDGL